MNMNAIIAARILTHITNGMDPRAAFDEVLGEGAFIKLAGDLYDAFRAA